MSKTAELTDDEAKTSRELVKLRGLDEAAQGLGVHKRTLAKAALGAPVHVLTASVIRGRLAVLP